MESKKKVHVKAFRSSLSALRLSGASLFSGAGVSHHAVSNAALVYRGIFSHSA